MRTNDVTPELIHISTQEQTNKAIKDPYNQCEYVPGIWNYKQRKQKKKKKKKKALKRSVNASSSSCFFIYIFLVSFCLQMTEMSPALTHVQTA